MVLASKKNPCYFCDICELVGALLTFIFFYDLNLVTFVILAIFAIFVTQSFIWQENVLLLLRFLLFLLYTFLISVFFATIAKIIC